MENKVYNVEVRARKDESGERLLKRFSKKCKKNDIVREYLDRVTCFKTNRQKKREKSEKIKWLRNKHLSRKK